MICETKNTVAITIAAYPDDIIAEKAKNINISCAKNGIKLIGMGGIYENHLYAKVYRMREWLKSLSSTFDFVLFTDIDCIFCGGLHEICNKFNSMSSDIAIGGEEQCHPMGFFRSFFLHMYPCAGCWMGKTTKIIELFNNIITTYEKVAIASMSFTKEENDFLVQRLKKDLDIEATTQKYINLFQIYIGPESYLKLIDTIKPLCNWKCFQYKHDLSKYQPQIYPSGELSGSSKLLYTDILKIKEFKSMGLSQKKIGKIFGVDPSAISKILNGKRWKRYTEMKEVLRPILT